MAKHLNIAVLLVAFVSSSAWAISVQEFSQRFQNARLPGNCGRLHLCWDNVRTNTCNADPIDETDTLSFRIESPDPKNNWFLRFNHPENFDSQKAQGPVEHITYQEVFKKSMPPGAPAFQSRYSLELRTHGNTIDHLKLYLEDFDPRTKAWEPYFDIRLDKANPVECASGAAPALL